MSTRNMTSELPLVLDVLSDDLEIVFSFLEKATISSFKLLQHPHFVRETSILGDPGATSRDDAIFSGESLL